MAFHILCPNGPSPLRVGWEMGQKHSFPQGRRKDFREQTQSMGKHFPHQSCSPHHHSAEWSSMPQTGKDKHLFLNSTPSLDSLLNTRKWVSVPAEIKVTHDFPTTWGAGRLDITVRIQLWRDRGTTSPEQSSKVADFSGVKTD